ncbi:MAG: signal peptidase I [Candidatus Levybacteria bacterium]|nr:signal peptidase I [Candidatus Levybacteria bacterium]
MKGIQKSFRFFFELSLWVCLISLLLIAITTISANSHLFGGYKSLLVQSGSMEPAIMTGDIIVIQKQPGYLKNDVITFTSQDNRIVTHRIIGQQNEQRFLTKGDANRSSDSDVISQNDVIGKVVFIIPKLGYFVGFSKSPIGFSLLIIFPAAALIIDQLLKMINAK